MGVLRTLESSIAGLVEGTFSRVFRSEVRPVEIARKLAREMDEHKSYSVSRTYVPNEFTVYLSPRDRERFADMEGALSRELSGHLLEHARREKLALLSTPVVAFKTDERLRLGEFGIQARLVEAGQQGSSGAPAAASAPRQGASGHTQVYSQAERLQDPPAQRASPSPPRGALLVHGGRRLVVPSGGAVLGRSRDCEIVVTDEGVSRHHADVRPHPSGGWVLTDLGSTNGVRLNGSKITAPAPLTEGDLIGLGSSELRFENG